MGFDNECVLNIQSLPGEYFCPVCRQLIYPNEAMQTQCTHLYCKPCLTYVLGTTKACPYDNYLVTEETSKALLESNPTLAETIGRVMVHCLYHKSGCTWQGGLTEGITHGQSCAYGSSPVVCNRCSTQIVHRQVQEHAMTCTGTQAQTQVQPQQQDATQQAQAAATQQPQTAAAAAAMATTTAPSQVQAHAQTQAQPGAQPAQAATAQNTTQASATDQWYQQYQQYQQYYQQYPQYYQQQFEQQQQQMQAQTQSQAQVQPQAQVRPQAQAQSQAQMQPHAPVQPQQHAQPQAQVHLQVHPQPQVPAAQMQHPQAQSHLQPQPHQQMGHPHQAHQQHMMPAQAQQVPIQQQMPIAQPYQQPAPGAHQAGHPTQLNQQIPGGAQQQHVQHHPHHAQMFPQQPPNQQHQVHIPQQQAAVHQPHHPQQQAMMQQVPPQLQQPNSAPVHQASPFPQQQQALPQHPTHQPHPQQQAQAPFHPQPIQNQQQLIPSHNNAPPQQQAQMQPPYHQGPPQQSFPQQYPHQGQINAVQQSGNRPPSQNFMQPPLQSPQLRASPSTYGSLPTKAFPTEAPNHGLVSNQQFMHRPGYRPPAPHQQRPPARQAGPARPAHQQPPSTSVISQASRMMPQVSGHGTLSSASPRPMPASGKGPETFGQAPTPKDSEQLGNDQQKVKDSRTEDANAVSGQSKVAAVGSVKGESSKIEGEENATQEPKKDSSFEPSFTENLKRMEQFSSKASESKNQDEESQQLISHNKELEDATQKPIEEDKEANSSIEPKKENSRLDGGLQPKPDQAPESNPSQNAFNQFKESGQRGEEKVGRSTVDGLRKDNVSQHLQRPDHSSQQNIHHGPLAQSHERNVYNSRQGVPPMQDRNTNNLQGRGRDFDSRSPHPIPIQERPAMPPSRPAQSHVQNTWQQPQHQVPVATSNIDRSAHQGVFHGHDNNLPQYMLSGRNAQQLPMQGQEKFYPPSNQGQFLGQKGAHPSQPEMNDKGFQQQPFLGQMHNAEHLRSGTSKVGNPMSIMPHLASNSSTLAPSVGRGPSHTHPPPTNFDLLSQNPQNVNLAPRSSQTDSMLGLSSGLSMSMPYPQNPFDVPRNVMEKGSHFPQSMPQSYSSKQMDHVDIMGGRKPDFMDKHKNEQQMMSSRFGMVQNEGIIKSPFEGLMGSSYPPVNGEDGVLRGMHHDSGRHLPERKDFFEDPRKYRATHFDEPLKSNSTDLFATSRYPKGTPTQFDKFVPTSRPAEVGTRGFTSDAASKFPLSSTESPGVGHSNPYTSRSFSPSRGSSMFSNIGDVPRLLGVQEEIKGRRPEPSALRSDFMGPRSDFGRTRLDTFGSRSPGKDYAGFSSARGNIDPASNLVGNGGPHIPRAGDEIGRDPIGFEDQRNKSYDFHSTSTYDAFPPPGNRHQPFRSSGFSAGGPGTMPNRMIMGEPGISSLGPNLSKRGFSGEGMLPKGPILNDLEPIELGRKRNPSTSGWCRICNLDCYTVEGLEQHSQTKEHQKKAMDMVMSIKKDSAKRQKITAEDPAPQENGKKAKRSSFEGRGSRR